jgi:hypothetical protein
LCFYQVEWIYARIPKLFKIELEAFVFSPRTVDVLARAPVIDFSPSEKGRCYLALLLPLLLSYGYWALFVN